MKYVIKDFFKSAIGLFIIAGILSLAYVQAAENNNMNKTLLFGIHGQKLFLSKLSTKISL